MIDAGGVTFVAICTACGARTLPAVDRGQALLEARHHEQRAHPGDDQTAQALAQWRARQRRAAELQHAELHRRDSSSVKNPAQAAQRESSTPRRRRRRPGHAR